MIKQRLEADLKQAMLSRDVLKVQTLRGLKSAILYAEVENGKREAGLEDSEVVAVFRKEVKKRLEAAELYNRAGSNDKEQAELEEKAIIESYLPEAMSLQELSSLVESALDELGLAVVTKREMGLLIKRVKEKAGDRADGALIAKAVNERVQV
jgi:hypothetical protein